MQLTTPAVRAVFVKDKDGMWVHKLCPLCAGTHPLVFCCQCEQKVGIFWDVNEVGKVRCGDHEPEYCFQVPVQPEKNDWDGASELPTK